MNTYPAVRKIVLHLKIKGEEKVPKLGKSTFRETVRYHTKRETLEFETNEGEGEPEPDNAGRKCS